VAQAPDITIITGLSGAGISSVLKALEDLGMEVFDNFPLTQFDALINESRDDGAPIAIGVDTRTRGFCAVALMGVAEKYGAKLVFLTCDDQELQRRFTETRRRHPLAKDRPVRVGIAQERTLLKDVQNAADLVFDTTTLSVHDLRHLMEGHFETRADGKMTITMMSFGFKHGAPREADIVMDVRFVKNPHWVDALRPLSGKDEKVGNYIDLDPHFPEFIGNFKRLVEPLLPRYEGEGKNYLTIAIGCTGGRHRSVYTAEQLSRWLRDLGRTVYIDHRDLKE